MGKRPLFVLFLIIFIDLLGFGIVIPILPIYAEELGASGWLIGVVVSGFSVMQFLFAPFWGGLSDRIGRRPVLITSMLIVASSYLLFSFSTTIFLLLLSRLLGGFGAANISAAQAYISDITPPERRARTFGIIGAAFGMGFIFGPPIGGFLKAEYGIPMVGYFAAALSFGSAVLAYFILPESIKVKDLTARIFTNPLKDILRHAGKPNVGSLLLVNLIFITAFSMMHTTASLLWKNQYGLGDDEIGYVFSFIGFTVALIQGTLIGKFQMLLGEKTMLVWGNILMAIGLLGMPYVAQEHFVPLELLFLLIISFGNAFLMPTLTSFLTRFAGEREQGSVLGSTQAVGALGRVIGPLVGGALYGFRPDAPYVASFFLLVITTFICYALVKRGREAG